MYKSQFSISVAEKLIKKIMLLAYLEYKPDEDKYKAVWKHSHSFSNIFTLRPIHAGLSIMLFV